LTRWLWYFWQAHLFNLDKTTIYGYHSYIIENIPDI